MAKLGDVLSRQFKKLGIDITDEIKPLTELDTEVTDEVAGKIDKGLLSIEAAKNNQEVIKHLKQQTLAGADNRMDELIKEHGITVDETFANEKNTYEKIAMLLKTSIDHGKKKAEAASKEGVSETVKKLREEFQQKEADYQNKLKAATESLTSKETEFKTSRENDLTSFELQKILLGKDYVFPKEMDSSLKVQTALGAINKDLATKGLVLKRNEAGSLVITDKDGNKAYTEKHEAIEDPNAYIDGILTHNKLLNINDPNAQGQQSSGSGGAGAQTVPINNGKTLGNAAVVQEIDSQLFK
jgi:hypothetical protein